MLPDPPAWIQIDHHELQKVHSLRDNIKTVNRNLWKCPNYETKKTNAVIVTDIFNRIWRLCNKLKAACSNHKWLNLMEHFMQSQSPIVKKLGLYFSKSHENKILSRKTLLVQIDGPWDSAWQSRQCYHGVISLRG